MGFSSKARAITGLSCFLGLLSHVHAQCLSGSCSGSSGSMQIDGKTYTCCSFNNKLCTSDWCPNTCSRRTDALDFRTSSGKAFWQITSFSQYWDCEEEWCLGKKIPRIAKASDRSSLVTYKFTDASFYDDEKYYVRVTYTDAEGATPDTAQGVYALKNSDCDVDGDDSSAVYSLWDSKIALYDNMCSGGWRHPRDTLYGRYEASFGPLYKGEKICFVNYCYLSSGDCADLTMQLSAYMNPRSNGESCNTDASRGYDGDLECLSGKCSGGTCQGLPPPPSPPPPPPSPPPSVMVTGSCTSNSRCASGSCKGGFCCTEKGMSEGCIACYDSSDGDCRTCDSGYSLIGYSCVAESSPPPPSPSPSPPPPPSPSPSPPPAIDDSSPSANVCDGQCSGGCTVQCPEGQGGCRSGSQSSKFYNGVGYTCCSALDKCNSVAAFPSEAGPAPSSGAKKVTGTVTLSGYTSSTFGATERSAFAAAMASIAGVQASDVKVTVEDARRHLLEGVKVTYEISVADDATSTAVKSAIVAKSPEEVVSEMQSAGLDKVTSAAVTVSDPPSSPGASTPASTPQPSTSPTSAPAAETPPEGLITIKSNQVFYSEGRMGSCIAFHVKSSWAVHVVVMETANFNAFANNGYTGQYVYIEGSQCKSSVECRQRVVGLDKTKSYVLAVFNRNVGSFVSSGTDVTFSMTRLTDGSCSFGDLPEPPDVELKPSPASRVSLSTLGVVLYFGVSYAVAALVAAA